MSHDQIGVATKLRRAVKHARLPAHEQRLHAMCPDRRKDFDYRARDQVNLAGRGKSARVSDFLPSVTKASIDTNLPIRQRHHEFRQQARRRLSAPCRELRRSPVPLQNLASFALPSTTCALMPTNTISIRTASV